MVLVKDLDLILVFLNKIKKKFVSIILPKLVTTVFYLRGMKG